MSLLLPSLRAVRKGLHVARTSAFRLRGGGWTVHPFMGRVSYHDWDRSPRGFVQRPDKFTSAAEVSARSTSSSLAIAPILVGVESRHHARPRASKSTVPG